MNAPIRVLFAIPSLDHGGPDRVMYELLQGLDRSRFTPSLMVSSPTGHYLERLPAGIPVEVLGDSGSFRDRYPLLRVLRFIRRTRPDIVFSTLRMTFTVGVVAPLLRAGTRVILRQANDVSADFAVLVKQSLIKHRLARQLSLATLRRADAVICQSTAMRTDLQGLLGREARLHAISNPIDVDAVTRVAASDHLRGSPALVSVGRLAPQKGFDILLAALQRVRATRPGVHLTIFGEGPERGRLETQARELGLEDTVTFAGFSAQVLPHVKAADLFVLASRYEGFPNAALEALACGTPVVLTDCPGANSEIVRPGLNGRLADSIEPTAFARALETAVDELAGYDRAQITDDTRRRFAAARIVAAYESVFSSVACATR